MKVKVLLNLGTEEFGPDAPTAGVHDLDDSLAESLIARQLAVPVSAKLVAAQGDAVGDAGEVKIGKPNAGNRSASKSNNKE